MGDEILTLYRTNHYGYEVEITKDDMPNDVFYSIADECGVDVAYKLLQKFAGNRIDVPVRGYDRLEKRIITREYVKTYSTNTIKELSRRLCISERYVCRVLEQNRVGVESEGQMHLFDKREV